MNVTSPIHRWRRVIGPDATILMDFMLNRCSGLIENLVIYPENMMKNLNLMRGLIFSQRITLSLPTLVFPAKTPMPWVQRNAMKVWEEGKDFQTELLATRRSAAISPKSEIRGGFRPRTTT